MKKEAQRKAILKWAGYKYREHERGDGQIDIICTRGGVEVDEPDIDSLDTIRQFEEELIREQKIAGSNMDHPHYACWTRYANLVPTMPFYRADLHASAEVKLKAMLEALGLWR